MGQLGRAWMNIKIRVHLQHVLRKRSLLSAKKRGFSLLSLLIQVPKILIQVPKIREHLILPLTANICYDKDF